MFLLKSSKFCVTFDRFSGIIIISFKVLNKKECKPSNGTVYFPSWFFTEYEFVCSKLLVVSWSIVFQIIIHNLVSIVYINVKEDLLCAEEFETWRSRRIQYHNSSIRVIYSKSQTLKWCDKNAELF